MTKLVMLAAFALALSLAQTPETLPPTTSHLAAPSKEITITIVGFLSLLATQLFGMWREYRQRQWDIEDRRQAREDMIRRAEAQQIETISTAVEIARVSNANRNHLADLMDHNTRVTLDAREKAAAAAAAAVAASAGFNEKLEALRRDLHDKVITKEGTSKTTSKDAP